MPGKGQNSPDGPTDGGDEISVHEAGVTLATMLAMAEDPLVSSDLFLEGIANKARQKVKPRLFAILEVDRECGIVCCSYSSMPERFPAGDEKPLTDSVWANSVLENNETYLAGIEEISDVFPDRELMQSLGCGSCLIVPIGSEEVALGAFLFLAKEGYFTSKRIKAAESLKDEGLKALMLSVFARAKESPSA